MGIHSSGLTLGVKLRLKNAWACIREGGTLLLGV